jgi:tetratricopeptide (TPR) repeat protein
VKPPPLPRPHPPKKRYLWVVILIASIVGILGLLLTLIPRETPVSPEVAKQQIYKWHNQVISLQEKAQYKEAIPIAEKAVELSEKTMGAEDLETAVFLDSLALTYSYSGAYARAEPLHERALKIREKMLGLEHPDTAVSFHNLGFLYSSMGNYPKAKLFFERALEVNEKKFGPEHLETANNLDHLAGVYSAMGDFEKSKQLYQRGLEIKENVLGAEHTSTATSINNLASLYCEMGEYKKAEPLNQRAIKIYEKALGPEHHKTTASINNLGLLYYSMGDYAKAEPLYQRALQRDEKVLGPDDLSIAIGLNNLAVLYESMGNYAKAEPLYQRALKINEKGLGSEHRQIGINLDNLGLLYRAMGDYSKAESYLQQAVKIMEKALDPNHPSVSTSLNNLATLYKDKGEYAKAELLYQRALKIGENGFGQEHPKTATYLDNLAGLYVSMGDYARAEALQQRALKIYEKALGPEHVDVAITLNNLAAMYVEMKDYKKAEPLYQRALKINEKVVGRDHPDTARNLDNLSMVYRATGEYAKAEPLCLRGLRIYEKAFGEENPHTAICLNNLGALYTAMGEYSKAESSYRRALKSQEKLLGPDHPESAVMLRNLTSLMLDMDKTAEAKLFAQRSKRAKLHVLANILSFASERQRMAYLQTQSPYTFFATLGQSEEIASSLLIYKGVVLDSLVEDRQIAEISTDPSLQKAVEELRQTKQRLNQLLLEAPKNPNEQMLKKHKAEEEALNHKLEEQEAILARHVAGLGCARRALSVTVEQVRKAIPSDTALIELVKYSHYLGKAKWEDRYGGVILKKQNDPEWVPLGNAEKIEKNIRLYQKSVRGETDEATLSKALHILYQQIWQPIERQLSKDSTTVIISPDGEFNFLSFATLLAEDDRFLGQKYQIRYMSSGRDLLREKSLKKDVLTLRTKGASQLIAWANPEYTKNSKAGSQNSELETESMAVRALETRDFRNMKLSPLPGTEKEGKILQLKSRSWGLEEAKVYFGSAATEKQLHEIQSPWILHLATHGFFLPEAQSRSDETSDEINNPRSGSRNPQFLKNPMHRSGLALAGAQTTLDAWAQGEIPASIDDGIVTAAEVGTLKLGGTWLVVLSACNTGAGEVKAGEGVLGLRRGFVSAGTQNLLMTLWPVADEETVAFMEAFYDRAMKTQQAPQALAELQAEWLQRLRKEKGLLYAVRIAGPFILSYQGDDK